MIPVAPFSPEVLAPGLPPWLKAQTLWLGVSRQGMDSFLNQLGPYNLFLGPAPLFWSHTGKTWPSGY